jgi:molecular chaperone HscA
MRRVDVRLAVDLGTTHTVAVIRRGGQPPRALLFDGSPLLASGVFVDAAGTPHTGRDAQRLGAGAPERYEPHPKRRIDEGTVLLGDRELPVELLLTAVLLRVADEARTAGVDPAGATLTCPADWGRPRREVLRDAARRAGLGEVRLVDEPIAAAAYCVEVLGQRVPPGGHLVVFDFGGGTFDVAVVRREPAGPRVLATGGLDDLGGLDVDSALVAHLGQLVGVYDPPAWHRLSAPADPAQRRDRQAFWSEVRAAKEMLSRASAAPVHVPGRSEPMHLTRDELERVAGPLVARAVDETRRVLERSGVPAAGLAGVLLVGGSSRMPLVASRLHARLGVTPTVPEQPELPVAYGALVYGGDAGTVGGGLAGPVSGRPYPVSGTFPPSVSPAPVPPPAWPPPAPPARPPAPTRPKSKGRRVVVFALVFVLVGGLATGVVSGARWLARTLDGGGTGSGNGNGTGLGSGADGNGSAAGAPLAEVHRVPLSRDGAADVLVAGDAVVYAVAGGGGTEVVSLPGGGGPPRWRKVVPVEPSGIRLTAVDDLIVLDAADASTHGGDDVRSVLAAGDGTVRWTKRWENRTDIAYVGTDVLVELEDSFTANAVLRVDLKTGKERWKRPGGDDSLVIDEHRIEAVRRWPDGKPTATLPGVEGTLFDTVAAAPDAVVELDADAGEGFLVDTGDGRPINRGELPIDNEIWTAYGGLVIGLLNDDSSGGKAVLAAYRLPSFTRAWQLPLTNGFTVDRIKACGRFLVCMAVDQPQTDETVAVDIRTGKRQWSVPVEWSDEEGWYVTGERLLFGEATFGPVSEGRVLTPEGKPVAGLDDIPYVTALRGKRMLVRATALAGSDVTWRVSVADAGTGKATAAVDVGAEPPIRTSIGGDLAAVVTVGREVLVLKAGELT